MPNNILLCCKQCGNILKPQTDIYICGTCFKSYEIVNGIVLMEARKQDVDLRIPKNLMDIHKLRYERKYFGSVIKSDVEYYAHLHSINFTKFHVELLSSYINDPAVIVDLGCGQLPSINYLHESIVKKYYGLDLSYESLVIANNNFKRHFPLTLVQHGITEIPFPDRSVDVVISSEVIEHIDHPFDHLIEIYRICKQGGYLSLSTPCASMYFYPFNFLYALKYPRRFKNWFNNWQKQINAHNYWDEALMWHPGLRPKILKDWIIKAGFSIVRHETKLWYYHTPIRLMWKTCAFLEKRGFSSASIVFKKYLEFTDKVLSLNIPIIKWSGIRQFILCQKSR